MLAFERRNESRDGNEDMGIPGQPILNVRRRRRLWPERAKNGPRRLVFGGLNVWTHATFWPFWNTLVLEMEGQIKYGWSNEFNLGAEGAKYHARTFMVHVIDLSLISNWGNCDHGSRYRTEQVWSNGMKALLSYLTSIFNQISWLHQNQHMGIILNGLFRVGSKLLIE